MNLAICQSAGDHEIKAAMLMKFTDFISWPNESFINSQDFFIVGVAGDDSVYKNLKEIEEKRIHNKKLLVVKIEPETEHKNLHILYIGSEESENWPAIKKKINNKYVLTVSPNKNFLLNGGILQFIEKSGGRTGFAINRYTQLKSGLKFSSYLLKLARIEYIEEAAN